MQLIILCSGQGSRFTAEGNTLPKPMLRIQGWSFLEISYKGLLTLTRFENVYVTVLKEHVKEFKIDKFVAEIVPKAKIVILDGLTSGPAESAFTAIRKSNIRGPVLVADCDQIFEIEAKGNYFDCLNQAVVFTFPSQNPGHAFALTKGEELVEVVEKRIVSDEAIAGAYYFKDANVFCDMYIPTFKDFTDERFISKVLNTYVRAGFKIGAYKTNWHQSFGTPSEQKIAESEPKISKLIRSIKK